MNRPRVPRLGRAAAFAAGALLLVLSFSSSAVAAERVTFRLLGSSPIYANAVNVHKAAGGTVRVRPARYHYRITTPASAGTASVTTEASGNCVNLSHYIVTGRDYSVDLQTAADAPELATGPYREAAWLLSRSEDLIASASDAGLEAGALQVAIWQLTGQARDLDAPSSDVALNARVSALRALAAGRSVPSSLAVSVAGGDTCLDTGAAVTVTGTPGAVVNLAVATAPGAAPTAQVSPRQVTIGPDGVASASLRSAAVGAVTVQATTAAPTLIRAAKVQGATTPQDQLFLRPGTLSAEATQNFIDCDLYLFAPGSPGATIPLAPAAPGGARRPGRARRAAAGDQPRQPEPRGSGRGCGPSPDGDQQRTAHRARPEGGPARRCRRLAGQRPRPEGQPGEGRPQRGPLDPVVPEGRSLGHPGAAGAGRPPHGRRGHPLHGRPARRPEHARTPPRSCGGWARPSRVSEPDVDVRAGSSMSPPVRPGNRPFH